MKIKITQGASEIELNGSSDEFVNLIGGAIEAFKGEADEEREQPTVEQLIDKVSDAVIAKQNVAKMQEEGLASAKAAAEQRQAEAAEQVEIVARQTREAEDAAYGPGDVVELAVI